MFDNLMILEGTVENVRFIYRRIGATHLSWVNGELLVWLVRSVLFIGGRNGKLSHCVRRFNLYTVRVEGRITSLTTHRTHSQKRTLGYEVLVVLGFNDLPFGLKLSPIYHCVFFKSKDGELWVWFGNDTFFVTLYNQ